MDFIYTPTEEDLILDYPEQKNKLKDILNNLFRYAIEIGPVNRVGLVTKFFVVEAKPEELRGFLEEAAGVSQYKERRHETLLRIEHTRENLARVMDIRDELGKQVQRLERQAKAAERYLIFKEEEQFF